MRSRALGELRLADPGVTMEPRGLTETTSRPTDVFTTAAAAAQAASDRATSRSWGNPRSSSTRHRLAVCGVWRLNQKQNLHTKKE